jgi:branched-chain amino acid aminotransferase
VREVDSRQLTCRGPMVERLQRLYSDCVDRDAEEQQRP